MLTLKQVYGKAGLQALIIAALFTALLPAPSTARPKHFSSKIAGTNKKTAAIPPAQECSKCHSDIFRNWQRSRHAASYENPVFQTAYRKAWLAEGETVADRCLPCHAPALAVIGGDAASQAIAGEGITCNSCHGVTAIERPASRPNQLKAASIPDNRTSSAGETSSYHGGNRGGTATEKKTCAGCHEFENRHKLHIGTTYSEWRASSASSADGRCQICHMRLTAGRTANKDGRNQMHDHSLATSLESVNGALTADVADIAVNGETLTASVIIRNVKAGHQVPTGSPARSLILEVRLQDAAGDVKEIQKRIYRKTLTDENGNEVKSFDDAFLYAAAVTADNRLAPGESRTETITFSTPPGDNARVAVELYLLSSPEVTQRNDMKIPLSVPAAN